MDVFPADPELSKHLEMVLHDAVRDLVRFEREAKVEFLSSAQRENIENFFQRIKQKRWATYLMARSSKVVANPEQPPSTIDKNFIDYLNALPDCQNKEKRLAYFIECQEIILTNAIPEDDNITLRLMHYFGNPVSFLPKRLWKPETDDEIKELRNISDTNQQVYEKILGIRGKLRESRR